MSGNPNMLPKETSADYCRRMGWGIGTRIVGDEGYGPTIITITAVGRVRLLAKADGRDENTWTLGHRDWQLVEPAPTDHTHAIAEAARQYVAAMGRLSNRTDVEGSLARAVGDAYTRLLHARAKRIEWTEYENAARAEIEHVLGGRDTGTLDGHVVVRYTTTKRTALDQKLLAALYPDALAQCKSTTEVRRFTIVEPS